jgi:radical SAM protein with 4Fe4S-binding SPASM domain
MSDLDKYELTRMRLRYEQFLNGFICTLPNEYTPRLLNRTAALVLESLDKGKTVGETIDYLQSLYPNAEPLIRADVESLLLRLIQLKMVQPRQSTRRHQHARFVPPAPSTWTAAYFSAPDRVQIAPTSACNLRCRHCYVPGIDRSSTMMTLEDYKHILDRLDKLGVHVIELSGGEPFLNPYIYDMIEYTAALDFSLIVFTNATLLEDVDLTALVQHVSEFIVSIDGLETYHDQFRGVKGAFRKSMQAIKRIKDAGGHVKVSFSVNHENEPFIDEVKREVTGWGVDGFLCAPAAPVGNAKLFRYTVEDYRRLIQVCDSAMSHSGREWRYAELPRSYSCAAGKRYLYISPDGDVYPCPLFATERFRIGHLPTDDLEQLWHESKVLEIFRRIEVPTTGPCKECTSCSVWCRAMKYYVTGELDGPPPYCERVAQAGGNAE